MAKTKVLTGFSANTPQYLNNRGGVTNIVLANQTSSAVTASVGIATPRATAYYIKDLTIDANTSVDVLDGSLLQTEANRLFVETNTTNGVHVIYTAL